MADSQYDQFRQAGITHDAVCSRLPGRNRGRGLNSSWCSPSPAAQEDALWPAMKKKWIHPARTGPRMTGPAAADYILASYPEMV